MRNGVICFLSFVLFAGAWGIPTRHVLASSLEIGVETATTVRNGTDSGEGNGTRPDGIATQEASATDVYRFEAVKVVADRLQAGRTTIEVPELESLPSRTGSVTEALKVVPNVQFSNEETSSFTAGEIRPPRVSIAGAKPYESNFLIDGMSVSNTLNPNGLGADGDSVSPGQLDVNGADQTIFYDTSLVDSVTVYSSNVPAKYGAFVGGVVDAELKDPRTDRWHGLLSGRYTRSEWFDLRGVDDESESSAMQPRFRQHALQAAVDGPIGENASLLLSASKRWSVIPMVLEENDGSFTDKDQYRSNENFFAKLLYTPRNDLELRLDATYAPYVEELWRPSWPGSEWELDNRSWRFAGEAVYLPGWGKVTGKLVYALNGYSRDSASNFREQISGSGVPDSEEVFRGGLGDAETTNRALDAGLDLEFDEFLTGDVSWRLSTGFDLSNVTTDMWNEATSISVYSLRSSGSWTLTEADYLESEQSATLNTLGWYGQAEIRWGRFTLTPGLRVDHEDFSHNTDLAPRLKAELDTMGDGTLRLVAGANRYYGGQLRAYAFDRNRGSFTRMELSSGRIRYLEGSDNSYQAKGLDTPYSDELMAGVLGEIAGLEYSLELVHRDHRKQIISKSAGDDVYELTNDGKSTFDGITLTLSRAFETGRFGTHTFRLGATKSRSKTFNGDYTSEVDVFDESGGYPYDYDQVYYNGEIIDRSDMPAADYNAPLVVTFSWHGSFWEDRFRVNCVNRWRDSTTGILSDQRTADETPYGTTASRPTTKSAEWLNAQGEYLDAYREGVISGGLVTDVSFEFDAVKEELFTMSLLFDISNVFSSDGHSNVNMPGELREFEHGRAYYAGIRCEF